MNGIRINPLTFLCVFLFSLSLNVFGQKVSKATYNGEEVFVYPFRTEVNYHSSYFNAMRSGIGGGNSMKSMFIAMSGGTFDRKEYKAYKKFVRGMGREYRAQEDRYLRSSKFKKAIRNNPYPLLEKRYTMDKDVIPSLDPIPDGHYVQYFDTFALIGTNGKSISVGDRVSGIFYIKNNMLDGPAVWLSIEGDTLKKGLFSEGMKVGEWRLESRRTEYSISKSNANQYIELGYPELDTTREIMHFVNGIMDGIYRRYENSAYPVNEGQMKDNEMVGEWLEREIGYIGIGAKRRPNRNNSVVTFRYTPQKSDVVVKRPIIRHALIPNLDYFYDDNFDFEPKYYPYINFNDMYRLNEVEETESLEMEEEKISTYEGGEDYAMEEEGYYGEEDEFMNDGYVRARYDSKTGVYQFYPQLIDSLGVKFNYSGIYEKRYPNGQLMVRYDFSDGNLTSEDTIYWDNGKPYDVIKFDSDSSQYIQTIYDYSGLLYKQLVFDSIGEFVRVNFEPEMSVNLVIDGFNAELRSPEDKYFFYDKLDTLSSDLTDSLVIFRSWYTGDTSLLYSRSYTPKERKLDFALYSVQGTPSLQAELIFAENFESWTGWKNYSAGDLRLETKSSASYISFYPKDSFPQNHVNSFDELFELSEDHVLKLKDVPFSGDVSIKFGKGKFKLNASKNDILLACMGANNYRKMKALNRQISKYRRTGSTKNELLSIIDASEVDEDYSSTVFNNLFGNFFYAFVEYPYELGYGKGRGEFYPQPVRMKGRFAGGKPDGIWQVTDQKGKLLCEIPYLNGEVNGTMKYYDYAYPRAPYDYMNVESGDTMPKRITYYLMRTTEYRNGVINGVSSSYNWLGEVISQETYKDGMQQGKAFERNKLAHTELNFLDGALDGYVKTWLTLPEKDSVLLFDLNFQNGLLQGESKSYHINGRVAKRGFFLDGEPIDDYEAYDTLGFKYHYVKFQYSYPVEEKIWEENELSVRYLFDWRDSIVFEPSDITSTQSLDQVLYDLGIGLDYLERPYFGRPSLIEKKGIDYHMTKYYPNDSIARDGGISSGKKVGCWKYWNYEGEFLYEIDYFDTIVSINDSVQFKAKGVLTDYDAAGKKQSESYIIEKFEKYDCSHTDHYEIRQLMTIWEASDSVRRMNGYVKNYYDNGVLQCEGNMKNGLPTGVWKFYDPYGKLNQVGEYVLGKRNGRWLGGDLSKTKYLGDICLNPNLPDLEEEIKYREKLIDIVITNYRMGKALNKEFYDVNLNNYDGEEETEETIEEE